jgi:hypothetical protein
MKKIPGIPIMLFFFLFACQNDNIQEEIIPADENVLLAKEIFAPLISYQADPAQFSIAHQRRGDAVERPIKFRSEGTLTFVYDSEACGDDETTMINQTLIEGHGQGSHMGNIIIHLSYCWHLGTGGMVVDGYVMGTVVASNGDEIYVVLTGSGNDEKGNFQNYQILDGSGRFTGATGSYTLYGLVDYETGVFWHEGEGVIVY